QANRGYEVEAELELRLRRDRQRQRLRIGVRTAVGDERERGTAEAGDLELRLEVASVRRERTHDRERESKVARALPVGLPAQRVDAPHGLGVEPDAGSEREAAPVHSPQGDPPCPSIPERLCDRSSCLDRVRRQPERPREHARTAARQEADWYVRLES